MLADVDDDVAMKAYCRKPNQRAPASGLRLLDPIRDGIEVKDAVFLLKPL
jgi:hypothetical protein